MAEDTESKTDDGATAAAAGKESTTTTTQSDDPTGSEPSTDTSKTTTEPASPAADDKSETPASPTVDRKDKTNGSKEEENKPKEETSPSIPSDTPGATPPVVSSSKRSRPPYKYDPEKITLRFLFANRDGLTVTVECAPADTVGEVKGALLSVWPEDLPSCSGGDHLRLICMGKGILMPDTRTLEDCQVPVFKTHPTPINVAIRPANTKIETSKKSGDAKNTAGGGGGASGGNGNATDQGCACIIL